MGVNLLAALAGAGYSVYAAAGEPVAQAMRAPAPERFGRTLAERLGIWRWLSQPTCIIWRQLERKPGKALLSIVGLALAGGIVIMADFQTSAITHMIDTEYRLARHYDISATLIDARPYQAVHELRALPGVHHAEGIRVVGARLYKDNRRQFTSCKGCLPTAPCAVWSIPSCNPCNWPRTAWCSTAIWPSRCKSAWATGSGSR